MSTLRKVLYSLHPECHGDFCLPVDGTKVTFGRKKECDVHVRDPRVSGRHCSFYICSSDDKVIVEDLGAKNKVFLNGVAILPNQTKTLEQDDIIVLGNTDVKAAKANNKQSELFVALRVSYIDEDEDSTATDSGEDLPIEPEVNDLPPPADPSTSSISLKSDISAVPQVPSDPIVKSDTIDRTPSATPKEPSPTPSPSPTPTPSLKRGRTDALAENMMCGICMDILHKPVSVLPCLHNYCSACYATSKLQCCAHCQAEIKDVQKNHQLASIIETFLTEHPSRRRDPDELKDMDEMDTVELKAPKRHRGYNAFSDDESENESDEEELCPTCNTRNPLCNDQTRHVHCTICYGNRNQNNLTACFVCKSSYCENCRPAKFKDYPPTFPTAFPQNNPSELKTTVDYIRTHSSLPEYHQRLGEILESKEVQDLLGNGKFSSEEVVCRSCFANTIKNYLIYAYRKEIPKDKLPPAIAARSDCWWGKHCRTQSRHPHAEKLNHICEQTRRG